MQGVNGLRASSTAPPAAASAASSGRFTSNDVGRDRQRDGRHRRHLPLRRRLHLRRRRPPPALPLPPWVNSTSIPGQYTTAATRLAHSSHPGDLTHTRIFYDGPLGATTSDRPWPHTRPNPVYSSDSARAQMLDAVAFLLWRGVSRLQDAVLPLIDSVAASQLDHLLSLARRALDSFEDFYRSVRWTVAYGPRQTEWHVEQEQKEYGPETNFWLKFRPTLTCQHAPRLGPSSAAQRRGTTRTRGRKPPRTS